MFFATVLGEEVVAKPLRIQQTPYNCLLKKTNFSTKTANYYITSSIIK